MSVSASAFYTAIHSNVGLLYLHTYAIIRFYTAGHSSIHVVLLYYTRTSKFIIATTDKKINTLLWSIDALQWSHAANQVEMFCELSQLENDVNMGQEVWVHWAFKRLWRKQVPKFKIVEKIAEQRADKKKRELGSKNARNRSMCQAIEPGTEVGLQPGSIRSLMAAPTSQSVPKLGKQDPLSGVKGKYRWKKYRVC